MLQSGLIATFWSEAIATACYIRNRCPASSLNETIPYEKWMGKQPGTNHLEIFGTKVYVLDKNLGKDKFAQGATKGVFVGYPRDRKGYRICVPDARKIIHARDVKFLENTEIKLRNPCDLDNIFTQVEKAEEKDKNHPRFVKFSSPQEKKNVADERDMSITPEVEVRPEEEQRRALGRPKLLRTGCRGRPRKIFHSPTPISEEIQASVQNDDLNKSEDEIFAGVAEVSVQAALKSDACEEWKDVIESEMMNLVRNDTFDIVETRDSENIVGCRLVLTDKHNPYGKLERRKARLVAKGHSQKYGVDYYQIFALVIRLQTL